jgi:hypothetical protein
VTASVVIVVEGVLQQNNGDGVNPQGTRLYEGFKDTYRLVLVSDMLEGDKVEYWLKINGFTEHALFLPGLLTDPDKVGGTRLRQLVNIRQAQNVVDFVVEPDPQVCAALLHDGIATMNYLHPKYSSPDHRPDWDGSPRPWDTLVAEVTRQEELRAKDVRPVQDDR